jgi:hypothetical protein
MWNSLCAIWRTLNNAVWILTALIVLYFLYTLSDGRCRFRFVFWQSTPVVNGNAAQEQVKPRNEIPGDE